jgi:hypothetical protein
MKNWVYFYQAKLNYQEWYYYQYINALLGGIKGKGRNFIVLEGANFFKATCSGG